MTAIRTGHIIFLTGPSNSGKSTLAACIQKVMPTPFLHFSSDHFAQALNPRRTTDGSFAYWSSVRPRFFMGLHRSIAAFAGAGNDLIVDHLIEFFPHGAMNCVSCCQVWMFFWSACTAQLRNLSDARGQGGSPHW